MDLGFWPPATRQHMCDALIYEVAHGNGRCIADDRDPSSHSYLLGRTIIVWNERTTLQNTHTHTHAENILQRTYSSVVLQ